MVATVPIKRIKTNDPERETWRYLQLFSSESYVAKLVKRKTVQKQISSCVRQAAEIYSLSKEASILTKPILLFYGMQRLAKALIFLRNPDVNPNDLKAHGLSARGIQDEPDKFLYTKIRKTKKGIFPEFSKWATRNNILLEMVIYEKGDYHHSRNFVHTCDIPDFMNASEFSAYDLFCLVPELVDLFNFFGMENNLLISCGSSFRKRVSGKIDVLFEIPKRLDLDSLKTRFPALNEFTDLVEESQTFVFMRKDKDEIVIPDSLVQAETKDLFLITSIINSNKISDPNVHFILMFLLCYVARYKAPLLEAIIEGWKEGKLIALIEKFIEISETKFPKLILDELLEQYLWFIKS